MALLTIKSKNTSVVAAADLMKLKAIDGISLSEWNERLKFGAVILEAELYGNNFAALAKKIKALVSLLKQANIKFTAYETGEGHLEANPDMESWAITEEVLNNLLEDASGYQ